MKLLNSTLPPTGSAGALFGLAVASNGEGVDFVDDDTNTLNLLHQGSGCEDHGRRSPGLIQLLGHRDREVVSCRSDLAPADQPDV